MKLWIGLMVLMGMSFAACYFDAGMGRVMCIEPKTETLVPSHSYLLTNMTPSIQTARVIRGLEEIADGRKQVTGLMPDEASLILGDLKEMQPAAQIGEAVRVSELPYIAQVAPKPVVKKDCLAEAERDWQSYCMIMWSQGMRLDCDNANAIEKKQIQERLAEGLQSAQYKCMSG